jgi:hypothetical protein
LRESCQAFQRTSIASPRPTDLPVGQITPARENLSSPRAKNISLFQKPESVVMFAPSRPDKRDVRVVTNVGRDAVDAGSVARRAAPAADGEVVWSWRPDAGAKFSQEAILAKVMGAKEPGPRGDHV